MWQIKISKRCLKDVQKAPKHIREAFSQIFLSKESVANPFDEHEMGAKLEKLEGAEDGNKVQLGQYRVGVFLDSSRTVVKAIRLLHRREIYRRFP